ncbi:MAG: tetratricopeptide repeat protein [Candidatus Omnitrophica bacterium]|nr:tetratricopeptide repeat protein [Candidatus Omnitrophota bacterium]MDD5430375.1 tetratricopeptide repeat protein [Candidatus Omnitrophota bacterium]
MKKYFFLFLLCFFATNGFFEEGYCKDSDEVSFGLAVKAFSDGFYDASSSLFERFIEDFSQSPLLCEAKLYRAKCYYYKKAYTQALDILNKLEASCKSAGITDQIYYWLAAIYSKGKDFERSGDYCHKVIESYPSSQFIWWARYLMASNDLEAKKTESAEKNFYEVIDESNNKEVKNLSYGQLLEFYSSNKNYSQLVSLAERYAKEFPRGRLIQKVYFYLGQGYYERNEWDKALENYNNALKLEKNLELRDLIYQGLGFVQLAKDDKIEAKIVIDKISDKQLRLFSQGVYYFKAQDYIQALETFNMFIRYYPSSNLLARAYLGKADTLYELGRLNDSVYAYRHILSTYKTLSFSDILNKAHYGLAWCYLKNGQFKKAIEEFKNTLEYADNPVVRVSSQIQIADAYQETGKYTEALDMYSSILEKYPNTMYSDYIQFQIGMSFLKKKDLDKAFLALKNLKNNFPNSKLVPQAQYYLAVGYFSQQDYAQAKNLLEDFISKFPQSELLAKVYYLYGKCFFNEKNYNQALEIFHQTSGKFHDKDVDELVFIDIGNTYLNLDMAKKAEKAWKEFLAKYPNSQYKGSVALYLGGLYEKDCNYFEAEKYYKKVADECQDSSWGKEGLLSLGHLYWSKGDIEKAKDYFEKISQEHTSLAQKAKLYLAKILTQEGDTAGALLIYEDIISLSSSASSIALLEKAFILKEQKKYSQAAEFFKLAKASGAESIEAEFSLGFCLEKAGIKREAVDQYFKLIYVLSGPKQGIASTEDTDYIIKAYFRIAKIYERDGQIKEAEKAYRKIVGLKTAEAKIAKLRLKELEKQQ